MLKLMRKRIDMFKQFIPTLFNAKKYYTILSLCAIVVTFLAYVNPEFYKIFINDIIIGKNIKLMPMVLGGYLFVFFINTGLGYIQFIAKNKFSNTSLYMLKCRLFDSILLRPVSCDKFNAAELKLRIEDDLKHLDLFIEDQTIDYVLSGVKIVITVILLYSINAYLATYAILIIPVTIIVENIIGKRRGYYHNIMRSNQQQTNAWLQKIIHGWRTVKALNLQEIETESYNKFLDVYSENNSKWMNLWVLSSRIFPRIKDEFFMKIMLYFLGGLLIINQGLSIGSLLVFITYFDMLKENVNKFAAKDSQLLESIPYLDRLLEEYALSQKNEFKNRSCCREISEKDDISIKLENVSFGYDNTDKWLINNINLQMNKGDIVAFAGKSGVGKSTLAKLISGIEVPSEGIITLNGIDINQISIETLYKNIGVVMQDSILFNTSILENLQYGQSSSYQDMVNACDRACILDDIKEMRDGFNTVIGDNGISLSGGQKQKLVLARQFLRNTNVIILDEATSSIDPYSESVILETIKELSSSHIIIIISHRQPPLAICNKFVNISEDGEINTFKKKENIS